MRLRRFNGSERPGQRLLGQCVDLHTQRGGAGGGLGESLDSEVVEGVIDLAGKVRQALHLGLVAARLGVLERLH